LNAGCGYGAFNRDWTVVLPLEARAEKFAAPVRSNARRLGAGGRALAGCRREQAPTDYAVWGGGATPAQALYMVELILPPKTAAA
jgi:hypothetical protein